MRFIEITDDKNIRRFHSIDQIESVTVAPTKKADEYIVSVILKEKNIYGKPRTMGGLLTADEVALITTPLTLATFEKQ